MILVGNSRGGARDLAQHLMKEENDHVQVHELCGFISHDLDGAFQEAYAVSRATKCKQFLFSLSLNPPADAQVSTEDFERAIDQSEKRLGLEGQPRAIVFHEKEGRRHAHAVWSRIDADTLTARQMSFHKMKLQEVSRELYREHGWRMPEGLADRSKSDPRNYTLTEWQHAKRVGKEAGQIKEAFQDAWAISDNRASFEHALKERGFWLAKGSRSAFVAIDYHGEIYSVPKQAKVKAKAVRDRLGDEDKLPSLAKAKETMAREMDAMISRLHDERYEKAAALKAEHNQRKQAMINKQRRERGEQDRLRIEREQRERSERQARFRKGLAGLWDRLRGERNRIAERNRLEAMQSQQRHKTERDVLIFRQLSERRALNERAKHLLNKVKEQQRELENDRQHIGQLAQANEPPGPKRQKRLGLPPQGQSPPRTSQSILRAAFDKSAERKRGRRDRSSDPARKRPDGDRDNGPSLDR
ncbi:MAG: relaxase [Pseudomonadota bacterium]